MTNDKDPNVWHSGPPPFVGFWLTSLCKDAETWRWWDGKRWSAPANPTNSNWAVQRYAQIKEGRPLAHILWRYYWPENARRPRPVVTDSGYTPFEAGVPVWIKRGGPDKRLAVWRGHGHTGFLFQHYATEDDMRRYPVLIYADGRLA